MKVRHITTGKEYEVITDPFWAGELKEGMICARTNVDAMEQSNPQRYRRIVETNAQVTVYYIQEPRTDFKILKEENND